MVDESKPGFFSRRIDGYPIVDFHDGDPLLRCGPLAALSPGNSLTGELPDFLSFS